MKKFAVAFFILLFGLFFAPSRSVISADAVEDNLQISTIYTDSVLEYSNLTNISKLTVNEDNIAYSLDGTNIIVLNKTTRETITIENSISIIDIKFIGDRLFVTTPSNVMVINDFSLDISTASILTGITFSNLKAFDIYEKDDIIYAGYIDNQTFYLNEYHSNDLTPVDQNPVHSVVSNKYSDAYLMAINDKSAYIATNIDAPVMYTQGYSSEEPTSNALSISYRIIDTFYFEGIEYILTFTNENLYLLDSTFNEIDKITVNPVGNVSLEITDIDFYNNEIFVSDKKNNGAIQTYIVKSVDDGFELAYKSVLVCSNNKSVGRFNNADGIYKVGDTIFVSDTGNNSIHIINNDGTTYSTTYIDNLDVDMSPNSIILDHDLNMYFIETASTNSVIHKYSMGETGYREITQYSTVSGANIGYISSMVSVNNTIYLLDYTKNQLLCITNNGMQAKVSNLNIPSINITLDSSSKIEYIRGLDKFIVYNDSTLYLLNINEQGVEKLNTLNLPSQVQSITADLKSIYLLHSDTISAYNISTDNQISLNNYNIIDDVFNNLSEIHFDIATREMLAYNDTRACLVTFPCNIVDTPFEISDFTTLTALNETDTLIPLTILNSPVIYEYPYHLGHTYNLDGLVTKAFAIEYSDSEYRILFNNKGTLTSGYIAKSSTMLETKKSENIAVITNNKKVPIYKYPTILKANNEALIVSEIPLKSNIIVNAKFPISIDGKNFYEYKFDGKIGYIFHADIVLDNDNSITYLETSNATIKAIGLEIIHLYSDEGETILLNLKNDDRVFVENFDKNSKYTKVVYRDSNLKTIEGYILTDYIKPDKIDNMTITIIIVIAISIILLVILIISYISIKKKKN